MKHGHWSNNTYKFRLKKSQLALKFKDKRSIFLYTSHTESNMCDSPPLLANGEVSPDDESSPVGTSLTFTCEVGYHLSQPSYRVKCENDENRGNTAEWSRGFPVCGE